MPGNGNPLISLRLKPELLRALDALVTYESARRNKDLRRGDLLREAIALLQKEVGNEPLGFLGNQDHALADRNGRANG